MKKTFQLCLDMIQSSQLYISETKLNVLLKGIRSSNLLKIEPISKEMDDEMVVTDRNTRSVAWLIS